jgi:hypothetical protein
MDLSNKTDAELRPLNTEMHATGRMRAEVRHEMAMRGVLAESYRVEIRVTNMGASPQIFDLRDGYIYAEANDLESADEAIEYVRSIVDRQP